MAMAAASPGKTRIGWIGTGVMGGMMSATFLAIFFIPMFFKLMSGGGLRERRNAAQLREEIEHHRRLMQESVDHPHRGIQPAAS